MYRYRVGWAGLPGGAGISTFYFDPGGNIVTWMTALNSLFQGVKADVAGIVTWSFPGNADIVDVDTGKLAGTLAVAPPTGFTATGSSSCSAPSGVEITWLTAGFVNGHRVKGRTYMVPTQGFDDTGTGGPTTGCTTNMRTAGQAYVTALNPHALVYSRPFAGRPAVGSRPAIPARLGTVWPMVSADSPPKFVVLRGRRDT